MRKTPSSQPRSKLLEKGSVPCDSLWFGVAWVSSKATDWWDSFPQDEDEEVYKRDFSAPTLEDHFNKTILPKVMQVWGFSVRETDLGLGVGWLVL
jgi:hypothetical protein